MQKHSPTIPQRAAIASIALIQPKVKFGVHPVVCDNLLVGYVEESDIATLEDACAASAIPYALDIGPKIRGGHMTGLMKGIANIVQGDNVCTITASGKTIRTVTNDMHDHVAIQDDHGEIIVEIDAVDALIESLQAISAIHRAGGRRRG